MLTRLVVLTVLSVLLCLPSRSYAQDYSFSLDQELVEVWIRQDGSVRLEYWFTFTCDFGAHPIDVVDVGLPNDEYALSDIRADVDGLPVDFIEQSEYVDHGVAVWLGDGTIDPGEQGSVHVVVERVGRMLYEDSQDADYASIEFSPTWFDGQFVHGTTNLGVRFHLPPGVQPEEPRWHRSPSGWPSAEPETGLDEDGRVTYTWNNAAADPDRQYTFGASFPGQYVDQGAIQRGPSALERVFGAISGAIACLAGTICNPIFLMFAIFAGFIGFSIWSQRRRRMQYLPPSMKLEGVGVKRGLTAVEAAIVLETPLDRVLTMMLFGLLKKGALTVLDDDPLKVQVNEPLPEGLHPYEKKFLGAVLKGGTLSQAQLRKTVVELVKTVNNKMKGFSRRETMQYYRGIVDRAWKQVEGAETPEVRSQRFDEGLEWTMLDEDFEDRTRRTFRTGPVFVPSWWGYYRPWATAGPRVSTGRAGTGRAPSSTGSGRGGVSLPTLPGGAFAASIVNGIQGTSANIVRNVTGFTGDVTQVTNPPPKPSSSSRSGGFGGSGGGGCACACACACAGCACACAGGGR